MKRLSKQWFTEHKHMDQLPERIIQFGEGNFLRGFVDWMVHQMNKQGLFNGRIVAIQPTPHGKVVPKLNAQDGLYTVALRGMENGEIIDEVEVVSSISRGINPYNDWQEVLKVAENKDIRFVFSNTTEAGLSYSAEEYKTEVSPLSFPGKLTAFLYHRYKVMNGAPDAGMKIFPCELLEDNGSLLRAIVLKIADDWKLPKLFTEWVQESNQFCNTLVDRIVTGYPKDHIDEYRTRLGYEDELITVGEPYHLFAIEADEETANTIPFHKAGLNVFWSDVRPFRDIKVRILNGAHTMMFAAGYLSGKKTVHEVMEDQLLREYVHRGIYTEILPVIKINETQSKAFADSVIERFSNPFNQHFLSDIGLNATFKYKSRLLPTLEDRILQEKKLPEIVTFSLAALIAYYQPERMQGSSQIIRDQPEVIELFMKSWSDLNNGNESIENLVKTILANQSIWGTDLNEIPDLPETVCHNLSAIVKSGMENAIAMSIEKED
ncbi:tagaturonate reductase [Peribacillus cavernae]|uniref:Tagaturonate reductase n=1 Tax=Peribacillus cavernae TaxID=1674310 RepID=A0A3S0U241_9BACI|nr:tagaturonate reductase [Peribacillus cavernae]MDQ0220704.1 tagaturonate reductase [Peribacillus cavernae]RUQ32423.1 tagaturonate reductase [Peribacillus cavernae]